MKRRRPQQRIPSTFTHREREILTARERGETYAAIAARFGISRGRAEQIASDALRRRQMVDRANVIATRSNDPRDTPVEILSLSSRVINALRKHGVATLGELERCTAEEILRMKNLGAASLREIKKQCASKWVKRP